MVRTLIQSEIRLKCRVREIVVIWGAPRVKHIVAPRIQHHVTEDGPPRSRGVLKVVAMLEQRPMILNAKLIYLPSPPAISVIIEIRVGD